VKSELTRFFQIAVDVLSGAARTCRCFAGGVDEVAKTSGGVDHLPSSWTVAGGLSDAEVERVEQTVSDSFAACFERSTA
jgi:hypothetical protein